MWLIFCAIAARAGDLVPALDWDLSHDTYLARNHPKTVDELLTQAAAIPDYALPMFLAASVTSLDTLPHDCRTALRFELGEAGRLLWRDVPSLGQCPGAIPDAAFFEPDALAAFKALDGPARTAALVGKLSGPGAIFEASAAAKMAWSDLLAFEWILRRLEALAPSETARAGVAALEPRLAAVLAVRSSWIEERLLRSMAETTLMYTPDQVLATYQLWAATMGLGGACRSALEAAFPDRSGVPDPKGRTAALAKCSKLSNREPFADTAARYVTAQAAAAATDPLTRKWFELDGLVQSKLDERIPALREQCRPAVANTWEINFSIDAGGRVTSASADLKGVEDAAFEECIRAAVKAWTFDPVANYITLPGILSLPPSCSVIVNVPFDARPEPTAIPAATVGAPVAEAAALLAWAHAGVDASMEKGGYRFLGEASGDCHGYDWEFAVKPGVGYNIMGVSGGLGVTIDAEVPGRAALVGTVKMGGPTRVIHTGLVAAEPDLAAATGRIRVRVANGACVQTVVLLFEQGAPPQ